LSNYARGNYCRGGVTDILTLIHDIDFNKIYIKIKGGKIPMQPVHYVVNFTKTIVSAVYAGLVKDLQYMSYQIKPLSPQKFGNL
jgi:hypothetical protein